MQINPLNINPNLVEIVNSNSVINGIRRINESNLNNNYKIFEKATAQDRTNIFISENIDSFNTIHEYNLKLQSNAPLVKLEKTNNIYDTSTNTERVKFFKRSNNNSIRNTDYDVENNPGEIKSGLGYYIVLNRTDNNSELKELKSYTDKLKEKIKEVYQLEFRKEPGTLVNLVF